MLPVLFGVLAGLQVNPVQATQDAWPALFDIAADDVLNLRDGSSAARRDRHGLVAVIDDVPLSGIIAARQCSDGMSDREYGLSLDAIFGEQVLSGCCTLAP